MIADSLLSEIHAQFRRQMNADISQTLQRNGVVYRICFGVPSMRLREVAERYAPSSELAEALWTEDIRESKMLATRLYPIDKMKVETAVRWASEARYEEIADQLCMNLLSRMHQAESLLSHLMEVDPHTEPLKFYCALQILHRRDDLPLKEEWRLKVEQVVADPELRASLRTTAYWLMER
jgi:3-methyladenine DNA glycosylase AlkD